MFLPAFNPPPARHAPNSRPRLTDPFGRAISYLRLSVTDRCDCRCVYCMPERMQFLPKRDVLSLEELGRLGSAFVRLGVRKIRLTGGEPLVRRDVMALIRLLSRHLRDGGLDELTLTTNASQLARYAGDLAACGVKRINVSLDTLDPEKFRAISRRGDLARVMAGLERRRRGRAQGQDQHRRAERRQRRRSRRTRRMGARPGLRFDLHRGDAARRIATGAPRSACSAG